MPKRASKLLVPRDKTIGVCVTRAEFENFQARRALTGLSMSDYVRTLVADHLKPLPVPKDAGAA